MPVVSASDVRSIFGVFLIATLLAMVTCGCATSPDSEAARIDTEAERHAEETIPGGRRVWPYWPAAMRVHPLTRLASEAESAQPQIHARVEFRDVDGFTTRCCGVLRFALHRRGEQPRYHEAIQTWEVDLRVLAENTLRFDDITQTYLVKLTLELTPEELSQAEVLWALYFGGDGAQLEASRADVLPR